MKFLTSPTTSHHQFTANYKALSLSSSSSTSSDSDSSTSSVRHGRIAKPSRERRERRKVMEKLQKMVPTAKEGDSQLKLLQDIMDYIIALQRQLNEDDMSDCENAHFALDISNLSEMFARFSTKSARIPLRPGQQLVSH